MSLSTLIVDDEPLARESLRLLLSRDPEIAIAGEATNGVEAVSLIQKLRPDLLLLDVQMPGMNGLDVLRSAGRLGSTAVVFVTAYDRYAIDAFESRALDYLLKPFTDERFQEVLSRAKRHIRDRTLAQFGERVLDLLDQPLERLTAPPHESRTSLLIKDGRRSVVVRVEDIDWIEATDYYARVHVQGASHLLRESLKSLEQTLDPATFVRVHRSALVNVTRVREVTPTASGDAEAILESGQRVRVSRSFRSALLSRVSLHRPSSR